MSSSTMEARLTSGAVSIAVEVHGYAYDSAATGPDANWLKASFKLETLEIRVQKALVVQAATVASWATEVLRSSTEGDIANLEEDFRLHLQGDCASLMVQLDRGGTGEVNLTFPTTQDTVLSFGQALEEMAWAYPPRDAQ